MRKAVFLCLFIPHAILQKQIWSVVRIRLNMASSSKEFISPATAFKNWDGVNAIQPLGLPIIDLSQLQHSSTRALAIEDIGRASQNLGCFKVINHGVHDTLIKDAVEAAKSFFELPEEEKMHLASKDIEKPVRYGGLNNSRAFVKQYAHPLSEWIDLWPMSPPDYREKIGSYATEVRKVALLIMDAILESLGLCQSYLREKLEEGIQLLVMNCYKQCHHMQDCNVGLAPHSDYGCITILFQSCEGLQIIDRNTGNWRAVPEIPETLHVHIGDILEVLSNGRCKALVHRALDNSNMRLSIASIHGFSMDQQVTTAKELVDEQHPKSYRDSSFREFLKYLTSTDFTNGRSFIDSLQNLRQ